MSLVLKIMKFYICKEHLKVLIYSNEGTKAQKWCIEWSEWPTDLGKCQTQYPHQWWFSPSHAAYCPILLPRVRRSISKSMGDSCSYRSPLRKLTSADFMTREQKLQHISESHQKWPLLWVVLFKNWLLSLFLNYLLYFPVIHWDVDYRFGQSKIYVLYISNNRHIIIILLLRKTQITKKIIQ